MPTATPIAPLAPLPALLTPAEAAALLNVKVRSVAYFEFKPIPVRSRGAGVRQHVRYRLVDVLACLGREVR